MIPIQKLKEGLAEFPDDAKVYAYEELLEVRRPLIMKNNSGIGVVIIGNKGIQIGWIDTGGE